MQHSLLFILPLLFVSCINQNNPTVPNPGDVPSNNIRQYLKRVAGEMTDFAALSILEDPEWTGDRTALQARFREMLSLTDVPVDGQRPPLNVRVTGTLQEPSALVLTVLMRYSIT